MLAERLESTHLDSVQQTVSEFSTSNRDLLENLSEQLNSILRQHNDVWVLADERQIADAQQKILDSLQFPQIQERRHRIHDAHEETYQWVLQPMPYHRQRWDKFLAWLSSCGAAKRIFWIHGKPGSGKSTLMCFLDENISVQPHASMAENGTVVRAQCFFGTPDTRYKSL